jgi:IS5 family transposase
MADQFTFGDLAWDGKGKKIRREVFLSEMDRVIPWKKLTALIAPHYPAGESGRPPMGIEKMLRVHFLQHWFNLSDPAAEEALYDSRSMQKFVGITLGEDAIPDETTILKFRHLLEEHDLPRKIFAVVQKLLVERHLLVKSGTIVDATILEAPSSTKNEAQARDPEMRQTKKGNTWHFGMKVHVGTDTKGIVHTITTTHAAAADITQILDLVRGPETALWGDRAYWRDRDHRIFRKFGLRYRVNRRSTPGKPLSDHWRAINQSRSRVRARVEHVFHVVKRLWGFQKVRYRGIKKNTDRVFTAFALANLYLLRRKLLVIRG